MSGRNFTLANHLQTKRTALSREAMSREGTWWLREMAPSSASKFTPVQRERLRKLLWTWQRESWETKRADSYIVCRAMPYEIRSMMPFRRTTMRRMTRILR